MRRTLCNLGFFIEPNLLKIKNYKISCSELQGIKIVYASDFHIAPEHKKRLQKIIKEINNQNPDLVLLGGDYVKGHKAKSSMPIRDIAAELKKITSKHGILALWVIMTGMSTARKLLLL